MQELGFVGQLAPFFLKRVFNIELRERISTSPLKQLLRAGALPAKRAVSKILGESAFVEMQVCKSCFFVQSRHPFSDDALTRHYSDFRTDSYNAERIRYEPTYRAIAHRNGVDPIEVKNRVTVATEWLADKLDIKGDFTMLDYGGADGRFLPTLPARKFVYDISTLPPFEGVTRISHESDLGQYSYVHIAHVLEHVVDPLKLTASVVEHVESGGYLYVEVPQEMSDAELEALNNGTYKWNISIHEHINRYSLSSATRLLEKVGLKVVAARADDVDLGWAQGVHVRVLGRKV